MVSVDGDEISWEDSSFEMQAKDDWMLVISAEFQMKAESPIQLETNGLKISSSTDVISSNCSLYKKVI